jgi:DNA-binding NarL/FixJ family response regulator
MAIHVYLADDHTMLREGLSVLLQAHMDIKVIGMASNGRQAVQDIAVLLPHVVIMDIAMPELNGVDATKILQKTAPATKTVILSMYATKEHIFRALQAGARGYLLKNSAGAELVNAVRAVQNGQLYLGQKIPESLVEDYKYKRHAVSPLNALSPREREVLQLVAEGRSSVQVADMLCLSPKSIETYRSRLMQKIGVHDVSGLVKFSIQHGLISLDY